MISILQQQSSSMDFQLTPEQMEKALKICDILNLQDFTVATIILEQNNWDLQKAMGSLQETVNEVQPQPVAQEPEQFNYDYEYNDEEQEGGNDYEEYEQILQMEEDLENKKKMFENEYESIPLNKTTSEVPNKLEKRLSYDRLLTEDYSKHRHQYQTNLLKNSQLFCQKILDSKGLEERERQKYFNSKRKNENNRKFIAELHHKYKTRINFTFGTFLLNLARSYLDKKSLLVYIHNSQFENNRSIQMLLTQREIAQFVNKHCISYGIYDSSDDYEVVQKYVPMKDLPAFALFTFDKKGQQQNFISSYIILQKNPESFMEWLATNIGVQIKKREPSMSEIKQEKNIPSFKPSDIIFEQNNEYEQMAKLYQLKREQSHLKKIEKAEIQYAISEARKKFEQEKQFVAGQTIEIKFRLPLSGKSLLRVFGNEEKVQEMFDYVSCFGREQFEQEFADFDLTQTFPRLSLVDRKKEQIGDIFDGSDRQNVIVKQI